MCEDNHLSREEIHKLKCQFKWLSRPNNGIVVYQCNREVFSNREPFGIMYISPQWCNALSFTEFKRKETCWAYMCHIQYKVLVVCLLPLDVFLKTHTMWWFEKWIQRVLSTFLLWASLHYNTRPRLLPGEQEVTIVLGPPH